MKRWPDCSDCSCINEGVCGLCSNTKTSESQIAFKKFSSGLISYSKWLKIYLGQTNE